MSKAKSNCPTEGVQYFTTLGYLRKYRDGADKKNPKSVSRRMRELLDDYDGLPPDVVVWATDGTTSEDYDVLMLDGKQVKMAELVMKMLF